MSAWKKYHIRRWKREYTSYHKICQSCRSFDFDNWIDSFRFIQNTDPKIYRLKLFIDGVLVDEF